MQYPEFNFPITSTPLGMFGSRKNVRIKELTWSLATNNNLHGTRIYCWGITTTIPVMLDDVH